LVTTAAAAPIGHGRLATLRHGEAAAVHRMPEAVHAGGDDGRSAEDVRVRVPAHATPEAGAAATPP
jgi:hypothetical protein